jgi:hypothetical protein
MCVVSVSEGCASWLKRASYTKFVVCNSSAKPVLCYPASSLQYTALSGVMASLYRFLMVARFEAYMLECQDQKMAKATVYHFPVKLSPPNKNINESKRKKKTGSICVW